MCELNYYLPSTGDSTDRTGEIRALLETLSSGSGEPGQPQGK